MYARWNTFWAERGETWHVSIFRLLWAFLHAEFAVTLLSWSFFERTLPTLPYPGFTIASQLPFTVFVVLTGAHMLGAVLLLLGWHTRVLQILLAVNAALLFFRSASIYQNHYALFLLVSATMTLLPSERFFSLDAVRERRRNPGGFPLWQHAPCSLFGQKLILLHASFLYAFAGLSKLDPSWFQRWSRTTEILDLMGGSFPTMFWSFLLTRNLAWIPLVLLIIAMFSLAVGIFFSRRYPLIALMGALMHLTFDLHLPIMQFTPMMLSILFLSLFPTASLRLQRVLAVCRHTTTQGTRRALQERRNQP